MTQKKTVEVVVGPQRLTLKTDQDPKHVQRVADLVNRRLGELLPAGQPLSHQVLLLLAMTLSEDLIRHQDDMKTVKAEVRTRSQAILTQLEREFPL